MTGKKLHFDQAAEQEANDIGKKFMNSQDVVGDMSRHYGVDLSSVRIHHDDSAARQAADRGVDAFSTGTDVFFGRGAFDRSDPASRGLLAHELSHSLQQGVGGGQPTVAQSTPMGAQQGGLIDWFRKQKLKRQQKKARKALERDPASVSFRQDGKLNTDVKKFWNENNNAPTIPLAGREDLADRVKERLGTMADGTHLADLGMENASESISLNGLGAYRHALAMSGQLGQDMTYEDIMYMYDDLYAGQKARVEKGGQPLSQEETQAVDQRFNRGLLSIKEINLKQLRKMRDKYGTLCTQMYPEDFIARLGPDWFQDTKPLQDAFVLTTTAPQFFDQENNADDKEYIQLSEYYNNAYFSLQNFMMSDRNMNSGKKGFDFTNRSGFMEGEASATEVATKLESQIGGPHISKRQQRKYNQELRKKYKKMKRPDKLFGRFR